MEELATTVDRLRSFYDADNRVGLLLDEIAKDIRSGAPRDEVIAEAREVQDIVGSSASAHRVIAQVFRAFGQASDA